MNRVLVTGATGFIGLEVSRQLSDAGCRPRLLVRRPHRSPLLTSLDADLVHGDLSSQLSLDRAASGCDTVLHLAARASFESYRKLRAANVDGSVALMRAAIDAGVKRFVFASSIFVYGSQEELIDQSTAPEPSLDYGRAKLETESALAEMAKHAGIHFAAVRLPHVYGPQALLFQQVRKGLVIFAGAMTNCCGHLHVHDAARVLIKVAELGWSGIAPVADRHPASWVEFFETLKHYYPRFRLLRLPQAIGYLGAAALSPLMSVRSRPTLYTSGTITGFNLNLPIDPDVLWEDIGLVPSYPTTREGIPAVLDDYLTFRWVHPMMDGTG